jgi:putative phosphoesterase
MQIAVLSDTHLRVGRSLPSWVWEHIIGSDLILHAGDVLTMECLTDLKSIAPLEVVKGNCDGWELASLPESKIIICEQVRIGLTHGAFGTGRTTPERAFNTFGRGSVDLIAFGHSHIPYSQWHEGVLLFNPGSPTDKRREPKYSMGLIRIAKTKFEAEHIFF